MASPESQTPNCPVCHRSDQVKTTQAAYESGVTRCAPPDMPIKQVSMFTYIIPCVLLVGICVISIFILIGGMEDKFPFYGQLILAIVTVVSILTALVLSYYAFQRVVRGDAETTVRFPAWDRAMTTWRGLDYCSRDDIVFDPKTNKVFTNEQLASLRNLNEEIGEAQSAMVQH